MAGGVWLVKFWAEFVLPEIPMKRYDRNLVESAGQFKASI